MPLNWSVYVQISDMDMRSMNIVYLTVVCLSVCELKRFVIWGSGVLDAGVFYISAELTDFGDIVVSLRSD